MSVEPKFDHFYHYFGQGSLLSLLAIAITCPLPFPSLTISTALAYLPYLGFTVLRLGALDIRSCVSASISISISKSKPEAVFLSYRRLGRNRSR